MIFATSENFFAGATVAANYLIQMCRGRNYGGSSMKSSVVKRSIVVAGHKTSVSLEDAFWRGLKEIASSRHLTLSEMVAAIDSARAQGNLSSAIRLFVLDHYRTLIEPAADTRTSRLEMAAKTSDGSAQ